MIFTHTDILNTIRKAWGPDTALNSDTWSAERPEVGQSAVSALLIDDLYEFPVQRGLATLPDGSTDSHYWNDGVDLTIRQYPIGTTIELRDGPQREEARAYLLSNPDVVRRYAILKARYEEISMHAAEVDK
jgi:hypothetical protein